MNNVSVSNASDLFQGLFVGDQIRYTALGGPTLGIVWDILDHVILVKAGETYILMHRDKIDAIFPKFR